MAQLHNAGFFSDCSSFDPSQAQTTTTQDDGACRRMRVRGPMDAVQCLSQLTLRLSRTSLGSVFLCFLKGRRRYAFQTPDLRRARLYLPRENEEVDEDNEENKENEVSEEN